MHSRLSLVCEVVGWVRWGHDGVGGCGPGSGGTDSVSEF